MAWIKLPGKASRYKQTDTGEEISRRQFDKLYGRLAAQGFTSNEKQAKHNRERDLDRYLSRSARGRTSLVRKSEIERQAALLERRLEYYDKQTKKRPPSMIRDSFLKKGRMGERFSIPYDLEALRNWLDAAAANPNIIGAGVGITFLVIETNQVKHVTARSIYMADYRRNPDRVMSRVEADLDKTAEKRGDDLIVSELTVVISSLFIWVSWSKDWLRANRGWVD